LVLSDFFIDPAISYRSVFVVQLSRPVELARPIVSDAMPFLRDRASGSFQIHDLKGVFEILYNKPGVPPTIIY